MLCGMFSTWEAFGAVVAFAGQGFTLHVLQQVLLWPAEFFAQQSGLVVPGEVQTEPACPAAELNKKGGTQGSPCTACYTGQLGPGRFMLHAPPA